MVSNLHRKKLFTVFTTDLKVSEISPLNSKAAVQIQSVETVQLLIPLPASIRNISDYLVENLKNSLD